MTWLKALLIFYALFLAASGLEAYIAKKSIFSLLGGGGAALAIGVAVLVIGRKPAAGYLLALVVALGMIGNFLPKFLRADNPVDAIWPSLTISGVSAIVAIALVLSHFLGKKAS